jgi:hypothetical protein
MRPDLGVVVLATLLCACDFYASHEPGVARGGGSATATAGQTAAAAGAGAQGGGAAQGGSASSPESGAGGGGGSGGPSAACSLASVAELRVFSPAWDRLGYPPYAISDCTVVYVALEGDGGALRRRDLETGADVQLDDASRHPSRPTIADGVLAWEHDDGEGGRAITVVTASPARTRTFAHAGEPRATADAVAFTKFLGAGPADDTDVHLYELASDEARAVASGPGQQRFADVSPSHLALTDFSEDPQGYFDEASAVADIVVIDRATGAAVRRPRPGKQAFPLLGADGALVYLEWGAVHPEPKFSQFYLNATRVSAPVDADFNVKGEGMVATDVAYVRPSLHGARIDFVDRLGEVQLYSADLAATEVRASPVALADAGRLFGPASSARVTLVSKQEQTPGLRLIAVPR